MPRFRCKKSFNANSYKIIKIKIVLNVQYNNHYAKGYYDYFPANHHSIEEILISESFSSLSSLSEIQAHLVIQVVVVVVGWFTTNFHIFSFLPHIIHKKMLYVM